MSSTKLKRAKYLEPRTSRLSRGPYRRLNRDLSPTAYTPDSIQWRNAPSDRDGVRTRLSDGSRVDRPLSPLSDPSANQGSHEGGMGKVNRLGIPLRRLPQRRLLL